MTTFVDWYILQIQCEYAVLKGTVYELENIVIVNKLPLHIVRVFVKLLLPLY